VPVTRLLRLALVAAVLLGGFAAGRIVTGVQPRLARELAPAGSGPASSTAPGAPDASDLPDVDVDGEEIAGLPRFPGSVRTDYSHGEEGGWERTEVEYLASATEEEVRRFYRALFERFGWVIADIEVEYAEWTYLVGRDVTEATIEIGARGGLVEIGIELTRPNPPVMTEAPSASPSEVTTTTPAPAEAAPEAIAPDAPALPAAPPLAVPPAPAALPADDDGEDVDFEVDD
jgi:hypothetical protein